LIKPDELETAEGEIVWNTLTAAADGDVAALGRILRHDPRLSRAEYWYTPAIHFAVREGHAEAVQLLLEAGADRRDPETAWGQSIDSSRFQAFDGHRGQ